MENNEVEGYEVSEDIDYALAQLPGMREPQRVRVLDMIDDSVPMVTPEVRAERIIENAKMQLIEMKNELMVIKAQKDSFAKRLRHLLESQLELLSVLEIDDLGFGEKKTSSLDKDTKYQSREPTKTLSDAGAKKKFDKIETEDNRRDVKISDQFIF